ncbi:MAG TPA: hypothetical protein VGG83_24840 [Trebonia sp.]
MSADEVRRVADAVLYEGYILYPYRASAQKNHSRWQFGVLMPPGYAAADPSESSMMQAECVLERRGDPAVEVTIRFLQVQRRRADDATPDTSVPDTVVLNTVVLNTGVPAVWDEAVKQEITVAVPSEALLSGDGDGDGDGDGGQATVTRFTVPGGTDTETTSGARVVRRREPLTGSVSVRATPLPGPWQAARLTVQLTNESAGSDGAAISRDDALPAALVAAHLIIRVSGGAFLSMTDPPEWASPQVGACRNTGCWPVLADPDGGRQVMLASPIILPDHPRVAPESPGELYDGTEIDEILTLRTLALSDEEKAAARATDPRAAALIDRVDAMDAPTMAQLHGTIRAMTGLRPVDDRANGLPVLGTGEGADGAGVPWWDPGADASVSPGTDSVVVAGHKVARGSRVILRPGMRRADAQDMFLAGRAALVEAVLLDVDDTAYLAVTLEDDPAADLQAAHGRFRYFSPDEVEPCPPEHAGAREDEGDADP